MSKTVIEVRRNPNGSLYSNGLMPEQWIRQVLDITGQEQAIVIVEVLND